MVAATSFAATPAVDDLAVVRELGSLLLSRSLIERRCWRAHVTARLVPVFAHYNLPLDRLREELRDAAAIGCPEPLQPVLAALLDGELARDRPRLAVLSRIVDARSRPDWAAAAFAGMGAALQAEAYERVAELQALVPLSFQGRMRAYAVSGAIARHGEHGAWGRFDGNLERAGSEAAFPASPSLVLALAAHAIARRDGTRGDGLERVIEQLGSLDRARGGAHVARVLRATVGERAAAIRLASLRDDSVRDAGRYLLARDAARAGDLDQARRWASAIRGRVGQQRATLAIAWLLFRTGQPLRARRELATVTDRAFEFERWRVRTLIAMQLRRAYPGGWPRYEGDLAPAWFGEPVIDFETRARLVHGVWLLRAGSCANELRDCRSCLIDAPANLRAAAHDRHGRREVIELLELLGVNVFDAIARMCAGDSSSQSTDILFAEWLAGRAETLLATAPELPAQLRRGVAGERPPTTEASMRRLASRHAADNIDAETVSELLGEKAPREPECPPAAERRIALEERRSLTRAIYDEGTAYSSPRRLGIVTAANACITGALDHPEDWDPDLVDCRIRTLALLGGRLALDVLESAALRSTGRYTLALFEALCQIDRDVAARVAIARATRRSDQIDPLDRETLVLVETYRGLPRGFTASWCATYTALANRLGTRRARGWLAELVAFRGTPTCELLGWLTSRAVVEALADPRSVLGFGEERCAALLHEWPVDAARKLADDRVLRETLELVRGVKVVTRARPWGDAEWTQMLRYAASVQTGVVDRGTVRRCARLLGCDEHALLAGDLWSLGARREEIIEPNGLQLRIRLLGKRGDLLAYLRFADVPIANCYRSDSELYLRTSQGDVIAVWKDPLSLCFRIERLDGRPFGFVFGGFAELAGGLGLAIVLNGLYLARQRFSIRAAVLHAIERMLCVPLGIRHVGVGNKFAGHGPFPADYHYRSVTGTRLRALRVGGGLVTESWDDISYDVNVPIALALRWRTL